MWDLSAKIFGWLLVICLILTVLFIMTSTVLSGGWGFFLSLVISMLYSLPVLIVLGIGYGVSVYMIPDKPVEVGDEMVENQQVEL